MAQPHRAAQPAHNSGGSTDHRGRYLAFMLIGGPVCLLGIYLILQSYSSDPSKFYLGLALAAVGGIVGFTGAVKRSNIRSRRQ